MSQNTIAQDDGSTRAESKVRQIVAAVHDQMVRQQAAVYYNCRVMNTSSIRTTSIMSSICQIVDLERFRDVRT